MIDLAVTLASVGEVEQAASLAEEVEARLEADLGGRPRSFTDHTMMAQVLAAAGRTSEAEEQLAIAMSMEVENASDRMELAESCAMLGDRECAVANTRLSLQEGYFDPFLPMLAPPLHSLFGDPEFMALFPIDGRTPEG